MLITYYHFINMEQTKKRGGARLNAGRKPSAIKKKPVTIYIPETIINEIGKENIKQTILKTFKTDSNDIDETNK